jgi:hypothetical protein
MSNVFTTFAATCEDKGITLIPSWHQYLPKDGSCGIDLDKFEFPADIAPIALAVVEILLRIGTFAAVAFVIYGGFQFLTSQGEPDKAAGARKTIINAVIGLVITLLATGIVAFIGRQLLV